MSRDPFQFQKSQYDTMLHSLHWVALMVHQPWQPFLALGYLSISWLVGLVARMSYEPSKEQGTESTYIDIRVYQYIYIYIYTCTYVNYCYNTKHAYM